MTKKNSSAVYKYRDLCVLSNSNARANESDNYISKILSSNMKAFKIQLWANFHVKKFMSIFEIEKGASTKLLYISKSERGKEKS